MAVQQLGGKHNRNMLYVVHKYINKVYKGWLLGLTYFLQ